MPETVLGAFVQDLQALRATVQRHCVRPHTAGARYQLREDQAHLRKQTEALRTGTPGVAPHLTERRHLYLGVVGMEAVHQTLTSAKTGIHSTPWELEAKAMEQYGFHRKEIKRRTAEYRKRKYLARRWVRQVNSDPLSEDATVESLIYVILRDCDAASVLRSNRVRIAHCKRSLIALESLIILSVNAMINRDIVFKISYALSAVPLGKAAHATD